MFRVDDRFRQFLTYAAIGVLNTGIHWGAFGCFYEFGSLSQSLSNLLGFLIAVTFSYVMNAKFTFQKQRNFAGYIKMTIIMAGIVGIYGLVAAIIVAPSMTFPYPLFKGYANLAGGLSVGLCGLSSGVCIGVAGNVAVRAMSEQPRLIMGAMLILIFGEVLGLYGFIVAIILSGKGATCDPI